METGSIASWNLKAGDTFAAGDVFCSVETDKATVDFEAQDEGVVAKILVDAGPAELKVGDPILVIVEDADDVPAFADFEASGGGGSAVAATPEPAAAAAPIAAPAVPAAPPVAAAPAASTATGGSVFASPLARTLAKEKGLDISQVPGTGPVGRVLAADVQEFTPSAASAALSATAGSSPSLVSPVSSGWESSSKRNIPHYYLSVDINVESVMKLRTELSESISLYAFLIKAAAKAMEAVPAVNAAYTDAFVRQYSNVDMNIEGGAGGVLTIPNCASLGLSAIETALTDDGEAAVAAPGTFTLLNLGVYGVTSCAPIIREPQACALAVGAVRDLATGPVLSATLSCDHRVVDGAVGAQWLAAFRNHIENPSTLLL